MAQLMKTKLIGLGSCRDAKVDTVDAFQGQETKVGVENIVC